MKRGRGWWGIHKCLPSLHPQLPLPFFVPSKHTSDPDNSTCQLFPIHTDRASRTLKQGEERVEMAEAVGLTVLGAVLSATLPKLLDAILNTTSKKDVRDTVYSLKQELDNFGQRIKGEEHRHKHSTTWNRLTTDVQGLAIEIQDCIDRFKIDKTKTNKFVEEIAGMKTKVLEKRAAIEAYLRSPGQEGDTNLDVMEIPPAPRLVGMEESERDLQALVDSLNQKKEPIVISVVGFGGLGKTCLARKVMDQAKKNNSFALFGYACVFGRKIEYVRNLMAQVCANLRSQGQKRYFIVIDGVQKMELAVIIRDSVSELGNVNQVGGIIIVTTTVQGIADCCSNAGHHVYKMRPLGSQESKELFDLVHSRRPTPNKDRSREIEEEFCDGLPLALISMARFCQGDECGCNEAWNDFCGDNVVRIKAMKAVLERSINQDLPPGGRGTHFRAGLLYFSLFPRGHRVRKGSLIRRWIAEGEFLCGGKVVNSDRAKDCLNALVDRNIIWPTQVSINGGKDAVKACRVPRAMHGYISGENFDPNTAHRNIKDRRWRSLQPGGEQNVLSNEESSKLRTLLVFSSTDALSFIKNCYLLQVLDLAEASRGKEKIDLGKIGEQLKLLKYLSLHAGIISHVGPEIENFECLETLDLGKKDTEVEVHVNVFKLPHLKHLLGKLKLDTWSFDYQVLSRKGFNGKSLQTVAGFVTCEGKGFPSLMDSMESLTKVKLFFGCPKANAADLTHLLSNHITTFISSNKSEKMLSIDFQDSTPVMVESKAMLDINNKTGLKIFSLKLRGNSKEDLKQFPYIGAKLSSITKLCLSWTNLQLGFAGLYLSFLDVLSEMEGLLYLKLVATEHIKVPPKTAIKAVPIKKEQFKNLQRICLMVMAEDGTLPMIAVQDNALENLASLHLICKGLGGPAEVMCRLSNGGNAVSTSEFPKLGGLKEITLHGQVKQKTKEAWHEAARRQQNPPQVLYVEDPKRSG